jgi:hypothetical protein
MCPLLNIGLFTEIRILRAILVFVSICGVQFLPDSWQTLPIDAPNRRVQWDSRYSGDLHRADMAWAIRAASRGLSEEEIRVELVHARNL